MCPIRHQAVCSSCLDLAQQKLVNEPKWLHIVVEVVVVAGMFDVDVDVGIASGPRTSECYCCIWPQRTSLASTVAQQDVIALGRDRRS